MPAYNILTDTSVPCDPVRVIFGPAEDTLAFSADPETGNVTVTSDGPVDFTFSAKEFASLVSILEASTEQA